MTQDELLHLIDQAAAEGWDQAAAEVWDPAAAKGSTELDLAGKSLELK
jgi:hypothetical protein